MDAIDFGIYVNYFLFGLSIVALILLEGFNLVKDTKALIKTAIVIVGLVILFFIAYSISTNEVTVKYAALGVGPGMSQMIGAGLFMLYIFLFVSIVGIIVSEVLKMFK